MERSAGTSAPTKAILTPGARPTAMQPATTTPGNTAPSSLGKRSTKLNVKMSVSKEGKIITGVTPTKAGTTVPQNMI